MQRTKAEWERWQKASRELAPEPKCEESAVTLTRTIRDGTRDGAAP